VKTAHQQLWTVDWIIILGSFWRGVVSRAMSMNLLFTINHHHGVRLLFWYPIILTACYSDNPLFQQPVVICFFHQKMLSCSRSGFLKFVCKCSILGFISAFNSSSFSKFHMSFLSFLKEIKFISITVRHTQSISCLRVDRLISADRATNMSFDLTDCHPIGW